MRRIWHRKSSKNKQAKKPQLFSYLNEKRTKESNVMVLEKKRQLNLSNKLNYCLTAAFNDDINADCENITGSLVN